MRDGKRSGGVRGLHMNKMQAFIKWGLLLVVCSSFTLLALRDDRPALYIIGDSTVKNGSGKGGGGLWGWGDFLGDHFDTTKIDIHNYALGGRSSRTFITEGHWDQILSQLRPGDMVIMQFGHNDGGALDDTARARGTIRGTGEETKDIYNPIMKKPETVHSYGWYMRKYVSDCKEKGVLSIICSPIPRNEWVDGKVVRGEHDYGKWAEETAITTGAYFVDLNNIIADQYDRIGPDSAKHFFPGDHTHTNEAGARLNANAVITGLQRIGNDPLKGYLLSIDRRALVLRHTVLNDKADPLSALSVGNGGFAFTVDITGLQSFPEYYEKGIPLGTESEWGWHRFMDTGHFRFDETLKKYPIHGRQISYAVQWKEPQRNKQAADWFRVNPHRLQLGNIGFELIKKDGTTASIEELTHVHQELNMWTGEIISRFTLEGIPVEVTTLAHPDQDLIAVKIHSGLIGEGRLHIRLRFPYPTGAFADAGDNWRQEGRHRSSILDSNSSGALLEHSLDSTRYFVAWAWSGEAYLQQKQLHYFVVTPRRDKDAAAGGPGNEFSFACRFSAGKPSSPPGTTAPPGSSTSGSSVFPMPSFDRAQAASAAAWEDFWTSGGAVDLSGSTDPRASELERRIVLSQYLTRIQCAGQAPPQETGLTYNSWYGKPHLEMHWWHGAHFALWGRPELLERSLGWYGKVAGKARNIAERQGYKGVRWQKMTGPDGEESPSSVGAFLVWQQPHFIYFAELCYRDHPDRATLEKYAALVFATADFMASYAWHDKATHRYILGKGLIPAQEKFKQEETFNPCFELAYWRWALTVARQWRTRLGLAANADWQRVLDGLSPLPQRAGLYLPAESATDSYTNERYREDHPAVLAAYGFLPAQAMGPKQAMGYAQAMGSPFPDTVVMRHTFEWVMKNWNWATTWGWDFPLVAMTATRLGLPDEAIDALLMPAKKNTYLSNGHNYQDERLRLYLPGNGGLLAAVALMCAGYDGCMRVNPGIPQNGKWKVRWEGLQRMP